MTNLAATSSPHKPNWNDTKEKIKRKFLALTDEDLFYYNGKKEEMLTNIQVKLGKTKKELNDIIGAL
ncbi:MAG: general stress protein CsbD [Bacteroidota bacterium]|nr:general stress protein CsbD [Bacteroidota bacterium]